MISLLKNYKVRASNGFIKGLLIKNQFLTIRFFADVKRPEWTFVFKNVTTKNSFTIIDKHKTILRGLVITKHKRIVRCVG